VVPGVVGVVGVVGVTGVVGVVGVGVGAVVVVGAGVVVVPPAAGPVLGAEVLPPGVLTGAELDELVDVEDELLWLVADLCDELEAVPGHT